MVYLDNAAGTAVFPEVSSEYKKIVDKYYPNPSANHKAGYQVRKKIEQSQDLLLRTLGIKDFEARVIWNSGGTEANNLAILGFFRAFSGPSKFSIVSSPTEHASVYAPIKRLEKEQKANVSWVTLDRKGRIDLEHFSDLLNEHTNLVSLCQIQNETGTVLNLERIREIMDKKSPRAKLHVDASQAFGKTIIPWELARIDLLTLSSHKMHGPCGLGSLVVRHLGNQLKPMIEGGGQQNNIRSGTLNAPGIISFSLAINKILPIRQEIGQSIFDMNQKIRRSLVLLKDKNGSKTKVQINSPEDASPYILNFSLLDYQGAVIMRMLGEHDVIVGVGSACSAESKSPSRVLKSMGFSDKVAYGSIRVSFSILNHPDDIDVFISKLQSVISEY